MEFPPTLPLQAPHLHTSVRNGIFELPDSTMELGVGTHPPFLSRLVHTIMTLSSQQASRRKGQGSKPGGAEESQDQSKAARRYEQQNHS